ncbi:hypothetical protein [Nocardia sp. NPDC050710]|uniref:hypothetical protein n=1 Tax=Nocardia sp. NPDC050710 TaxID=3157220 RepID=UPI003409FE1C
MDACGVDVDVDCAETVAGCINRVGYLIYLSGGVGADGVVAMVCGMRLQVRQLICA